MEAHVTLTKDKINQVPVNRGAVGTGKACNNAIISMSPTAAASHNLRTLHTPLLSLA